MATAAAGATTAWLLGRAAARSRAPEPARSRVVPEPERAGDGLALALPERPRDALTASALLDELEALELPAIEERLVAEVLRGNVPAFLRALRPISMPDRSGGSVEVFATPDYLSVGSDDDHVRIPLTAVSAQRLASALDAVLPTPSLVDAVVAAADVRLPAMGIEALPEWKWVDQVREHRRLLQEALARAGAEPGALVAGHMKDVVASPLLRAHPDRVAIYGLHGLADEPLQPLSTIHFLFYVDYSHGVRLLADRLVSSGRTSRLSAWLTDPERARRLGTEPLSMPPYPERWSDAPQGVRLDAVERPSRSLARGRPHEDEERVDP